MQECINGDESFLKLLHELCDKSIWLSVTTKDLYYWIEILNKVDEIMGKPYSFNILKHFL